MRLNRVIHRLPKPLVPELEHLLVLLEGIGLRSTDQVAFTDQWDIFKLISELETDNRNSDVAFSFQAFSAAYDPLYEHCLSIEAATAIRGDQLLLAEEEKARDLHWDGTGLEGLDELLHGFSGTGIIEMTGKSEVGKTLLSLHVVLRHLSMDPSVTCTWIDTRASFSPKRAQDILRILSISDADSVLERLHVMDCFDVDNLRSVLQQIDSSLAFEALAEVSFDSEAGPPPQLSDEKPGRPRIIVIDTLTNILAPILAASASQGQPEIHALMEGLQEMVRKYDLLTLVTQTPVTALPTFPLSAFSTTTVKPPLGTSFTYFPDISLLLQKSTDVFVMDSYERKMMGTRATKTTTGDLLERIGADQESRIVVEVIKNRSGPSGTWVMFHTDGIQLHDVTVA